MHFLLQEATRAGVEVVLGTALDRQTTAAPTVSSIAAAWARPRELPDLRGVRGERLVVRTREIELQPAGAPAASAPADLRRAMGRRPAHDRRHRHRERGCRARHGALGAGAARHRPMRCTRPSARPRSWMGAGVRPAFADNVPKASCGQHHPRQRPLPARLPAGAGAGELVADYLETGAIDNRVFSIIGLRPSPRLSALARLPSPRPVDSLVNMRSSVLRLTAQRGQEFGFPFQRQRCDLAKRGFAPAV